MTSAEFPCNGDHGDIERMEAELNQTREENERLRGVLVDLMDLFFTSGSAPSGKVAIPGGNREPAAEGRKPALSGPRVDRLGTVPGADPSSTVTPAAAGQKPALSLRRSAP